VHDPLGPDARLVDQPLQHTGRGQQDAPTAEFVDQRRGEFRRRAARSGDGGQPCGDRARLGAAEAPEPAAPHQLGQMLAPALRTEAVDLQRRRIGVDLPGDVGEHCCGWRLARLQRAAGMPEGEQQQCIGQPVVRAALGRDEGEVVGGQGAVPHHLQFLGRQREHPSPERII
jgi:hypothetical protein